MSTQGRFFTAQDFPVGPSGDESGVTVWDSQLSATLGWGLTHHWEIGITPVLLQKNHETGTSADSPGDLFLFSKFGSIGSLTSPFKLALQLDARIPLGEHHNIPLQPYSANSVGYGGTGMLSINTRPQQPATGWAFDFNVGYFNHNDQGLELDDSEIDTITVETSTQEIFAGVAARFMGKKFGLFSEAHARLFLQEPPTVAYTREHSAYFSQGVIYQFNPFIRVVSSVDVLLLGKLDETQYFSETGTTLIEKPWETLSNLPEWRFNVGLEFRLRQGSMPQPKPKTEKAQRAESRKVEDEEPEERSIEELQRRLQEKQQQPGESQEAWEERMQRERQRMEELLQKLRERLKEQEEQRRQEELERQRQEELKAQEQQEQQPDELQPQGEQLPEEPQAEQLPDDPGAQQRSDENQQAEESQSPETPPDEPLEESSDPEQPSTDDQEAEEPQQNEEQPQGEGSAKAPQEEPRPDDPDMEQQSVESQPAEEPAGQETPIESQNDEQSSEEETEQPEP
mgnify:CR=1 FL=1